MGKCWLKSEFTVSLTAKVEYFYPLLHPNFIETKGCPLTIIIIIIILTNNNYKYIYYNNSIYRPVVQESRSVGYSFMTR